ncbi:MAG: hypothetical protein ABR573_03700 [Candidatus Dormibacteria bacterium]
MKQQGILAAAALAGLAVAGCGQPNVVLPKTVKLAMAYKAGTTQSYKFTMTMKGSLGTATGATPLNSTVTATETLKALSVDPDGTVTFQVVVSDISGTTNGQPIPESARKTGSTTTIKMARDGSVVLINAPAAVVGGGATDAAQSGMNQITPFLPGYAVKPGDTWTKAVDQANPLGTGRIVYTASNRYLRDQKLRGHTDAVIESKATIPVDVTTDLTKILAASGASNPAAAAAFKGVSAIQKGTTITDNTAYLDQAAGRLDRSHIVMNLNLNQTLVGAPAGSKLNSSGPTTYKADMTIDLDSLS